MKDRLKWYTWQSWERIFFFWGGGNHLPITVSTLFHIRVVTVLFNFYMRLPQGEKLHKMQTFEEKSWPSEKMRPGDGIQSDYIKAKSLSDVSRQFSKLLLPQFGLIALQTKNLLTFRLKELYYGGLCCWISLLINQNIPRESTVASNYLHSSNLRF